MSKAFEYIYGLHTVRHALRLNPDKVLSVWVQDNKKNNKEVNDILQLSVKIGIHHEYVPKATLDKHAGNAQHQGIVIRCKTRSVAGMLELDEILKNKDHAPPLLLILDGIQDPQNLGACIRTANAAGVDAVIIPKDKSVGVNATVSKVASGGVENTPVITVTNLSRTINYLQNAGVWVVGADNKAENSLYEIDLTVPLAIVLGAEAKGIRPNTRKHCDYLASLPMHGIVESLNVSVAAGICLYEVIRQRRS
jgi:23S rRNA (guanosine2251-2'-O)-methyltransferase